ncbi:DedA family protein [Amphritea opalescens]|uniref:DedA family protein n=1 Tax=Amphritea opalescens TaxID=2490544 RepID=A0A430KMR9_9GAMM|nr:YqaA family protein [Amphritea opalescens]RTE64746.1 DedA family protein [Amphritea opalescens]
MANPELWGLFFSSFIASTLMPGGSEVLLGYLLTQSTIEPLELLLVASLGNSLGGILTFAMGWWVSLRWAIPQPKKRHQQRALNILRRYGVVALLLSWLPLIGDPLCLAAGWLRCSVWQSLLLIIVGKTLRYLLIIWAIH